MCWQGENNIKSGAILSCNWQSTDGLSAMQNGQVTADSFNTLLDSKPYYQLQTDFAIQNALKVQSKPF